MRRVSLASEMVEIQVVVVDSSSRTIATFDTADGIALPRLSIYGGLRLASHLTRTIRETWGFEVVVLGFLEGDDFAARYVAVELLSDAAQNPRFTMLHPEQLRRCGVPARELANLFEMLEGTTSIPFSHVGWIDEAISWVTEMTGLTLGSKSLIEQWNFSGNFALLRFKMNNGKGYWLKATGMPNEHEYGITTSLSASYSGFLPSLVGVRKGWNAWLTEEFGLSLPDRPSEKALTCVAKTFAALQLQTSVDTEMILAVGALDHRTSTLREHTEPIGRFLVESMSRQKSTKAAPISPDGLLELMVIVRNACDHMACLDIPDALLHNDLTTGNILFDGTRCLFTDWSEAAVGNPFLSSARLHLLSAEHRGLINAVYEECWSTRLSNRVICEALTLAPLLDIFAYLVGRRDWTEPQARSANFESYARGLARHMDRAARIPALRSLLCH
jgi:hypothetical protein